MNGFKMVEKKNPLALHGLFDSRESAEKFLRETVPVYVARGYYMDKTLTADSFEIREVDERPLHDCAECRAGDEAAKKRGITYPLKLKKDGSKS